MSFLRDLIWLCAGVLLIAPESARAVVGIAALLAWGLFNGRQSRG